MEIKKFEELYNESAAPAPSGGGGVANATLGNTGGMGAIVAPQPSSIPGDVAGSTKGSGDLPAYDKGNHFGINTKKKKKKKNKSKATKENRHLGNTNDITSMYVTKFTDWEKAN